MPNKTALDMAVEQRVACDVGEFIKNTVGRTTITNIITPTSKGRFIFRAKSFSQANKTIRLKVWGSKSGTGEKVAHFSMVRNKTFDKYQVLESVPLGSQSGNFYFEIVITAVNANSQRVNTIITLDSAISTINTRETKIKLNHDQILRIYGDCSESTDVITVNKYEMYICG